MYGAADLFSRDRFRMLAEDGRLCANEGVLVLLACKMRANLLKCGLSHITNDCTVVLIAEILAFARADEMNWTVHDCLLRFLYNFADAKILPAHKLQAKSSKRGFCSNVYIRPVYAKAVFRYVEKFCDADKSRESAEAE